MSVQPRTGFQVIPGVPSSLRVHSMLVFPIVISPRVSIMPWMHGANTGGRMGSKLGVLKVAAKRLGLRFEEYTAKLEAGFKWCIQCRSWNPVGEFGTDNSRDHKR